MGDAEERLLVIDNRSVERRTIHSITITPDSLMPDIFELSSNTFPKIMEASGNLEVLVTFHPTYIDDFTGQITIASDDSLAPTVTVQLAGSGVTPSALLQNFPNPFIIEEHETTHFPFDLSQDVEGARITIRTLNGNLVREIPLGTLQKGQYRAYSWDGKNEDGEWVAGGIYFYTFKAGSFIETKKMAVIR